MRLTLRRLLAWLDGILPADEQHSVGEKVSAGQFASMLVERIRHVVSQPAIGAPAPDARGLGGDANSVAQFIHTTLPVEHLERFERICFESDMHLAEVAACHALFAEFTRDPSVLQGLDGRVSEQLKTLVRQRRAEEAAGIHSRSPGTDAADHDESRETARALRAVLGGAPGDTAQAGLPLTAAHPAPGAAAGDAALPPPPSVVDRHAPDGRGPTAKRSSRNAWMSAIVAVSLLLTLCGVLAWSVLWKSGRRTGPQQVAMARPADATGGPPVEGVAPSEPRPSAVAGDAAPPAAAARVEPPAREDVVATPPAAEATVPPATVAMAAGPSAAAPRPEPAPPAADTPAPMAAGSKPVKAAVADVAAFTVGGGTLLRLPKDSKTKEWQFAAADTPLVPGDELLVPPWCEATLKVGAGEVRLLAFANVIVMAARDGTPWLEVLAGRVVVDVGPRDRIGVTTGGVTGVISVNPAATAATKVAIEAGSSRFVAADAAAPAQSIGFITAGRSPFVWQPTGADGVVAPGTRPVEVAPAAAVVWRGSQTELATSVSPLPWFDGPEPLDRYHRRAAEQLTAKIATGPPLMLSLKELADARQVEYRMIAATTLALLGESDSLVEMLAAEPSSGNKLENRQWEALEAMAVPAVIASGGEAAAGLHKSFAKLGPRDKADLLGAMARGFSDAEIQGGADRILVNALEDQSLMVRRYAYKTLCDITRPSATDRLQYRPDGLPDMRAAGVAWWRGQLERGLIHR